MHPHSLKSLLGNVTLKTRMNKNSIFISNKKIVDDKIKEHVFQRAKVQNMEPKSQNKKEKQRMTKDKHISFNGICKWVKLIIRKA